MSQQKGFSVVEGLLVVFVIAIIGFSGYYVMNRNNNDDTQLSVESSESSELAEELPTDLEGLKSFEELETIAGVSDTVSVLSYKLESDDSMTKLVMILSNGKKLVLDAKTGEILSEEDTDISEYSSNVPVAFSLKEAYALAAARYSNPIKEIEFEMEDNKATYKIEYTDGSKIEIDASTGSVIKAETKNEKFEEKSYDDEDEEDEDDEDEVEDEEDEDDEDEEDEEDDENEDERES